MSQRARNARTVPDTLFPKGVWIALIILDTAMLIVGFLSRQFSLSVLALLLALIIDRYGCAALLGAHEADFKSTDSNHLTIQEGRELMLGLRKHHLVRKQERAAKKTVQ